MVNDPYIFQHVRQNILPFTHALPIAITVDEPRSNIGKVDKPSTVRQIDIKPRTCIYDPDVGVEKKAHTMLRIKRKKMNRHKYEKRQRKLRFVYMRIRRERYAKKENKFRSEIAMKLKELEKFDPVEFVNSRLEKYRQIVLPNRIKGGVRMPPFVIIECLEKKKILKEEKAAKEKRKQVFVAENGGTLDVKN